MSSAPVLALSPEPAPAGQRFAPLAAVMGERALVRACAVVAGVQVGLCAMGIPAWPCVFYHMTGLPCPGCGLTRSCVSLLHGRVGDSLRYHPFGPLLLLGIAALFVCAVLPRGMQARFAAGLARAERSTRFTYLLAILFCAYWPLRLAGVFPLPG